MVDTREAGDAVRRRRNCEGCGNRFTTYERAETNVTVTKRDGRRERFDSQKLLGGLERAANKRPVSSEQLVELSESIAAAVRRSGPEVEAGQIGDLDELEAVVRRYKEDPLPGADQLALEGEPDGDPGPSGPESSIGLSPLGKSRRVAHTRRGHARQP